MKKGWGGHYDNTKETKGRIMDFDCGAAPHRLYLSDSKLDLYAGKRTCTFLYLYWSVQRMGIFYSKADYTGPDETVYDRHRYFDGFLVFDQKPEILLFSLRPPASDRTVPLVSVLFAHAVYSHADGSGGDVDWKTGKRSFTGEGDTFMHTDSVALFTGADQ